MGKSTQLTKELLAIDLWLAREGNTKALLASSLGYSSSTAISQWFRRKRIPIYMKQRAMEIILK